MAGVYRTALTKLMQGEIDLTGGTCTAYLVTPAYVPSLTSNSTISDVPSEAREEAATVAGRSVSDGVWSAAPTTFNAATGADVNAVVVAVDDNLVAYFDDFGAGPGATTLSLNGSDVTVNWPTTGLLQLG